jgi:hypothetical protein
VGNWQQPIAIEALNESGRGVRAEFAWDGDRYSHTIVGVRGNKSFSLLQSQEGDRNDHSPPSPCLTELYQQDQIFLLTGATSTSYWSLSVRSQVIHLDNDDVSTIDLDGSSSPINALVFEVACRVKRADCLLGSSYSVLNETKCDVFTTGKLAFAAGPSAEPTFGILFRSPTRISSTDQQSLNFVPEDKLANRYPYTVEWRYEIVWALR